MLANFDRATGIPTSIRKLLGILPIMVGESAADYAELMALVRADVEPQGLQEWLLLKDIVDAEWELLRLRRLKVGMLHATLPRTVLAELGAGGGSAAPDASLVPLIRKHVSGLIAGDAHAQGELAALLDAQHLTLDGITAAAFQSTIGPQLHSDRMLGAAYERRRAAYAELARLRARDEIRPLPARRSAADQDATPAPADGAAAGASPSTGQDRSAHATPPH